MSEERMTTAVDLLDVDAFVRGDHHAMLARLRASDPVYRHPAAHGSGAFWALTRYADIAAAYLDHATFRSSGGAMLGGSFRSEADTAAGRMLVSSDPPHHRLLRQHVHRAFAPDILDRAARQVGILVDDAVEKALAAGGCDFAADIATELPAGVLMVMMGIDHTDAHELIRLTRQMIGFRDPAYVDTSSDERLRLAGIQAEIFEFFDELVHERRARPGDDVVSTLLAADLNGRRLSEEDILYNCMNVAVGGNETTSHTASAGIVALAERPDAYHQLLAEPGLVQPAIAEILRWSSVNAYVQRIAARDVELHGARIRAGDSVTLWNVSANRDEEQFPDAGVFRIDRTPNRHLSYGAGIHRCIGASLAQVELSVLFGRFVHGRVTFRLAGPVTRVRSNFILGLTSVPVELSR